MLVIVCEFEFYTNHHNRDVPLTAFPANSWQRNQTYVGLFINSSLHLVNRSMEAIYEEYGKGGETSDRSMFELSFYDNLSISLKVMIFEESTG